MQKPSVSIIMNCYNNASTLAEALQSVLDQSFKDWEVIFWDSNSHDQSLHIAQSFAKKLAQHQNNSQIHCFKTISSMPLGQARNAAMNKACGKYIAFLDCDDIWLPSKLAKQVQLMQQNPKIALVCTNTENFYAHKSLNNIFTTTKPKRGQVFSDLIGTQWIAMSSAMLRHEHLKSLRGTKPYFDEQLCICEEAELFYALAYNYEFDYIDEILTKRRIHHQNATFTHWHKLALETEYILQKQYELYPNFAENYPELVSILSDRATFQRSVDLWRQKKGSLARKLLQKQSNFSLKHKLFYLVSFLPSSLFPYILRLYLKFAKFFILK